MTNELRNRIEDFIVDWNNTVNDFTSMADYDIWLETAIGLLEESIWRKEMWVICWEDNFGERLWEVVSGEDAMQIRVDKMVKSGIVSENIVVGEVIETIGEKK